MATPTPSFPIVFLVELLDPYTGELEEADVSGKLDLAVEKVYWHLANYSDSHVEVEVSFDEDGVIEGVGFFNEEHEMISCITVYHLDRDTDDPEDSRIRNACSGPLVELQSKLNVIFRN
jgi:hypothetical protein